MKTGHNRRCASTVADRPSGDGKGTIQDITLTTELHRLVTFDLIMI